MWVCADAHAPQRTSAAAETRPFYTFLHHFLTRLAPFGGSLHPLGHAFTRFSLLFSPLFDTLLPVLVPFYSFLAPFTPFLLFFVSFTPFWTFFTGFWSLFTPFGNLFLRLLTHNTPFRPLLKLYTTFETLDCITLTATPTQHPTQL